MDRRGRRPDLLSRARRLLSGLLENLSGLHHEADVGQRRDVVERVGVTAMISAQRPGADAAGVLTDIEQSQKR